MRRILTLPAVATVLISSLAPAHSYPVGALSKTENVRLIKRFRFQGGLELATARGYVFASQWNGHHNRYENPKRGGIHVFSARRPIRKVAFLHCPGADNDVARAGPGLIAVGYQENSCGKSEPGMNGIFVANVNRPTRPRAIASEIVYGAHTISKYPGKPIIYTSPAGFNNTGREDIVDVSRPRRPRLVASFEPPGFACHDIGFDIRRNRKLAFCPQVGGGEVQIWDVKDPLAPQVIGHIVNESIQYGHSAYASPDGSILAITDEAWVSHDCTSGESATGRVWFYDISNPELPLLLSSVAPPRGQTGFGTIQGWVPSYCTAALLDWIPRTRKVIVSWYTGGINILDLSEPTQPEEVAHYMPRNALAYGVAWYKRRLFVNDINRGLEVLKVRGMRKR